MENLHSNPKLFAGDTSLFLIITDAALSNSHLNDSLSNNNDWYDKWKLSFNSESTKSAHENPSMKSFSVAKKNNVHYPPLHLTTFLLSAFNLTII